MLVRNLFFEDLFSTKFIKKYSLTKLKIVNNFGYSIKMQNKLEILFFLKIKNNCILCNNNEFVNYLIYNIKKKKKIWLKY